MNIDLVRQIQELVDSGRSAEVRPAVEKLLAENPALDTVVWDAVQQFVARGGAGTALDLATPLHVKYPDNAEVHMAMALGHYARGEIVRALAHCDFVLHKFPQSSAALATRAKIMLIVNNEFQLTDMGMRLLGNNEPEVLELLRHILIRLYNAGRAPENLSIGGGPSFHHAGWINLDPASGALNPEPFLFNVSLTLPVKDETLCLAYAADCLQRLDDETVDRLLVELRRCVRRDGFLVCKIPDFAQILHAWNAGDENYFRSSWDLNPCIATWTGNNLPATVNACAAHLFCSYWTEAYGGPAARFKPPAPVAAPDAYFGPPVLPDKEFHAALQLGSPHETAACLTARMRQQQGEKTIYVNHQNAWSQAELDALLRRHGFAVLSMDRELIKRRFDNVPTIETMLDTSLYCVAAPAA